MYHKVHPESPSRWWVDVDSFYRQLCELASGKVVYLDDYDPRDPDHVVITFDGVYKNVLEFAAPLLRRHRYPFELFVTGDYLGRDNSFDVGEPPARFADAEDLKKLVACGGRLQWHTRTHQNLNRLRDPLLLRRELTVPDELRALDPTGFRWFAYPHGDISRDAIDQVKELFEGAVSCVQGDDADRYQLNRLTVINSSSFKKASIGVVVACFNYGRFLTEAVESVLRQSRPVDEILIMDDCSSDTTEEVGRDFQQRFPDRVRYHRNERNLGIVGNFNAALKLCQTDYACFLGADNRFRSDFIERAAALLDAKADVAIAYSDFALFGERARALYETIRERRRGPILGDTFYVVQFEDFSEDLRGRLDRKSNFMHGSSLFRRSAFEEVGGYREGGGRAEDHDLFFRMIERGWKAERLPYPLLEYRQHSGDQAETVRSQWLFYRRRAAWLEHELRRFDREVARLSIVDFLRLKRKAARRRRRRRRERARSDVRPE